MARHDASASGGFETLGQPPVDEVWKRFAGRLESVQTMAAARDLAFDAPPPQQAAERLLHANLVYFLFNLQPPGAASVDELQAYTRLVSRLAEAGQLDQSAAESVNATLALQLRMKT